MVHIAHIVNPFRPPAGTEWEWVQPITFASMLRAQAHAAEAGDARVELRTAQFAGDRGYAPEGFVPTTDLTRSVRDLYPDKPPLPFVGDILDRLYQESEAEWLIFTNSDIALQPHFYSEIAGIISRGYDAFIINRRRIPGHYRKVEELEKMYAEPGKKHPGFDCFVFHRSLATGFETGKICLGIPFIGIITAQNLFANARNFKLFEDELLTFHIGEEVFKPRDQELLQHNRREFWQAIQKLDPKLDSRKFPYGKEFFFKRIIKWGLHPSIPIRLALKLEFRRLFGG